MSPRECPATRLVASASKKPARPIIRQMSSKQLATQKVKAGNTSSMENPATRLAADAEKRNVRRDIRQIRRVQAARKWQTRPITRVIPCANIASTAMRANNAVALRDKSQTATADVRLLANIRRKRLAKAAFPTAAVAPKIAKVAITVRHATKAIHCL